MSLRARVAAAAAAAIVLAVVALVVAVPRFLEHELRASLEDALQRRAADVAQLNATAPGQLTAPGALEGRLSGSTLYVQVVDGQGRIVARSSSLGGRVIEAGGALARTLRTRQPRYADGALGPEPLRVYAGPLGELGRGAAAGGAVLVAGSLDEIDRTLAPTRRLFLPTALAAIVVAALLATLLTRRALRPLTRLSQGARAIERSGDVTERLPRSTARDEVGELAETLNAMLASLQRAQEAEHRFVGDASHELRTPLTALRGNAAYVARHGADPEVLADMEKGAERLSELLDDLLALAREDAAAPARGEPTALKELAVGADEVVVERDVVASIERPAFARAVENLVRNARKHGSGTVTITVGATEDGMAFLRVQDEGPGIPVSEREQVFERFARGSTAAGEGSGLGLAIVRAIAERHGGRVEVEGAAITLLVRELSRSPRTTPSR
jgi:two-component system, OmpR family, sensor kinase